MRTKLILASVLLSSCSYFHVPLLSPYKMDIRQGNYVTAEMRDKLKLGMSKSQVRYVLGTPMVSDVFHGDRWDYPYRLEQRGEVVEKQDLTLYFEGDNLVRVAQAGKVVQDMPSVAPPVVEAPAPVARVEPDAEVLNSVQAWAAAWSAKNARDYLAAYTPDFAPQGLSRDAWEKQRLDRISKPKVIEVALSDIVVSVQDDSHATASFTQDYRSDAYHDRVEKTLHLVKQSGSWLIVEELAGKAVKTRAKAEADKPAVADAQPAGGGEQAVRDAVKRWAEVWAARDVEKYLASYAEGFKPGGISKAAWEAQRRERIGKAASIAVEVSDLDIKLRDDSHASATFRQAYRSDTHQDNTRKTLQLEKVGDAWLIVAEQAK